MKKKSPLNNEDYIPTIVIQGCRFKHVYILPDLSNLKNMLGHCSLD